MSMLAEPKKKVKWGLNPRGNLWANDESKFGQQLLEKMGWQKGKGLGKHENGRTENINVVSKDDNKGVGWDDKTNNWVAHQDDFNSLLADLNKDYADQNSASVTSEQSEDAINSQKKPVSLEVRSKTFKSRMHYKKFVSGKDVSQYSVEDMGCIFGKKLTNFQIQLSTWNTNGTSTNSIVEKDNIQDSLKTKELPAKETELSNISGVSTFTSSASVSDYFAQKMKLKTSAQKGIGHAAYRNLACEEDGDAKVDAHKDIATNEKKSEKRKFSQLGETSGISRLKNADITFSDQSKPIFLHNESSSQQSSDSNSSDSECPQDDSDSTIVRENKRKKKTEHLEDRKSSPEIEIIEYELKTQPKTVVHSSSSETSIAVSESIDSESCSKGTKLSKDQIHDSQRKDDSTHSTLKKSNDCQSKQIMPSKSSVKRQSDINLLKKYQTLCSNNRARSNDFDRQVSTSSVYRNNLESWNSVLKLARKLKRYKQLDKKIAMDDFLSSTNISSYRGYGVRSDD